MYIRVRLRAPKKRAPRVLCCDATFRRRISPVMRFAAIIVAGGGGGRAGGEVSKQYKRLGGETVIAWSGSAPTSPGAGGNVIACAPAHAQLFPAPITLPAPPRPDSNSSSVLCLEKKNNYKMKYTL